MTLQDLKLKRYPKERLISFIEVAKNWEFCYAPASIKRMYQNWLRNDKERRNFDTVFKEKYEIHKKKQEKIKLDFESFQVGWLELNWLDCTYRVHLAGQDSYTVSYLPETVNKTNKMRQSLKNFCKLNSVKLKPSKTKDVLLIETIFKE